MVTTFQKAVVGVLAVGLAVIALVLAAKGPAAADTPVAGGPLTLVSSGNGGIAPGIVVVGEAKLSYRPDVAYVTFGAVEQAATAGQAQQQLADRIARVLDRARSLGIQDKDIANGGYDIVPQYAYDKGSAPRITGYQATQQVVVTLRDVNAVGRALDALVRDDGATTAAVRFALASGKDPELDARTRAIQDAHDKADAMAKAAGVRLGAAVSITDAGSPGPRPYQYAIPAAGMPKDAVSQIPTGDVEMTVRMQVQFGIAP